MTRSRLTAVLALGWALALSAVFLVRTGLIPEPARQEPAGPSSPPGHFGLASRDDATRAEARFDRAVCLVGSSNLSWFGTYVGGDAFIGRVVSLPFVLDDEKLDIPILGYPHAPGNALDLEVLDAAGRVVFTRRFLGANPHETPGQWRVAVPGQRGRRARLVLTDGDTSPGGWLAIAPPLESRRPGAFWLWGVRRDYGWFAVGAAALAGLLFLPGLAWRWHRRQVRLSSAASVALPGLLLLAGFGLGAWRIGPSALRIPALLWLGLNILLALALASRCWRGRKPALPKENAAWWVYGCAVVGALAFAILPLSVAQEYNPRTTAQARMVASPPDHAIPYQTAVYFWHGKNGREDSDLYFGPAWSVASRGPLAALVITGGFVFLGGPATPNLELSLNAWPASSDGFYVARILGILTNALVILIGAALAESMARGAGRTAVCWLGLAPALVIDLDFLWPKLLATGFVLLAVRWGWERRPVGWISGGLGLAYLSHPLGGLMVPPVLGFLLLQAGLERGGTLAVRLRAASGVAAGLLLWLAVLVAPWLAYKHWVGHADPFFRYPWGDGQGFERAASVASWLRCRWSNLWLTLTPGGFYFSTCMRDWLEGPISNPLRWAIGYAKTLPGGVGLAASVVAAVSLVRPAPPAWRGYRLSLLVGSLALMLVFWGFSYDGLGRNCLTPLPVLLIVYAAARFPAWAGWPMVLLLTAAESLSVRAIGIFFAPSYEARQWNGEAGIDAALVLLATFAPLLILLKPASRRGG